MKQVVRKQKTKKLFNTWLITGSMMDSNWLFINKVMLILKIAMQLSSEDLFSKVFL